MSKAKHTPGPWAFDRYGKIIGANGEPVVLGGVSISCGRVSKDDPCHANDRIVCAALDTLEALELVMDRLVHRHEVDIAAVTARAAIAKARGEA